MSGLADARREARGVRVTVAVALLTVATVLVVLALATQQLVLIEACAVLTVVLAWVALRLAWNALVLARYQHAVARTDLARTYRGLFAERAVEHAAYTSSMDSRLAWSRQHADDLRESLSKVEMRAVEAEATAREAWARVNRYDDQIAAMTLLLERAYDSEPEVDAGSESGSDHTGAGEWTAFEPDPIASLMAWEEHANRVRVRSGSACESSPMSSRGRHSAG